MAAALRIFSMCARHSSPRRPPSAAPCSIPRKQRPASLNRLTAWSGMYKKDARAQSDYFSSVIVDYSRVFAVLSLLCVLGAAGVFIYINRSVISRLRKLSENMRRSANGTAAPILISGNDEIADMAKAADFFATSLVQREQGLRESVAELRAL